MADLSTAPIARWATSTGCSPSYGACCFRRVATVRVAPGLPGAVRLALTYRKDRTMALMGALGFVMQWYLISRWSWWWQGSAFGGRMFIACTPIFAMGLASLLNAISQRRSWSLVFVVSALLLAWNFLLFVEYRFWLVYAEEEQIATWYDVSLGRITYFLQRLS